jgi:hypothetical protein
MNQWKAAQSWGHQRHGEAKGCSCDRASQRCCEDSSTGFFGSSTMAAPLRPEPFHGRGPGTMPTAEPPTSSSLGKALPGIKRGFPPLLEGKEKVSPLPGRNWRTRQDLRAHGRRILPGSPCHRPGTRMGDARWKYSVVDLQKTSLPGQAL